MFSCLQLADKPLNLGQETLVLSQQLDAVVAVAVVVVVATGALVNTARTVRVVHIICGWLTITPRQSLKQNRSKLHSWQKLTHHFRGGVTIIYNTTSLSLCREICLLAHHLHKTFSTFYNKTSTIQ